MKLERTLAIGLLVRNVAQRNNQYLVREAGVGGVVFEIERRQATFEV